MTKLLHTADWQIGRLYGSFDPDDAVPLADARFAAIERLARLAADERVDAVLVANLVRGEEFDGGTESVADRQAEVGGGRPVEQGRGPRRLRAAPASCCRAGDQFSGPKHFA